MKNIVYNAQTGETVIQEVPDVEMSVIASLPTLEQRVEAVEETITDLETVVQIIAGV